MKPSRSILCRLLFLFLVLILSSCTGRRYNGVATAGEMLTTYPEPIEILFGYDAPPNAFHDENGDYVGLLVDYLREIERILDYRFRSRDFENWDDLMTYASESSGFIIIGIARTHERETYLSFTDSFIQVPYVLVTGRDSDIEGMEDIRGRSVCTVAGYAVNDYLAERYPWISPEHVVDNLKGLQAVSSGRYDAMIINQMYATYLIGSEGIVNLKIAGDSGYRNRLSAASSVRDPLLLDVLNEAVDTIPAERRRELYRRWVSGGTSETIRKTLRGMGLGIGVLVLVLLSLWAWNRTLKRRIRDRTSDLEMSRTRLRTILDSLPVSIYVKNSQGRFLLVNDATAESMGGTVEEIVGMSQTDTHAPGKDLDQMLAQDRSVMEAGKPLLIPMELVKGTDGRNIWMRTEKMPMAEEVFGEPAVLGISTDITRLKETEDSLEALNSELEAKVKQRTDELTEVNRSLQQRLEELHQLQERLVREERSAAVGNMVSGIAHEINTPLGNAMLGTSYLRDQLEALKTDVESGNTEAPAQAIPALYETGELLLQSMRQASNLVEQFKQLALTGFEDGPEEFDVGEILTDLRAILYREIKTGRVELRIRAGDALPLTNYPEGLSRVITNLVKNSLDHAFVDRDGGIIEISAARGPGGLSLRYTDDGRGLNEEERLQLFDPFYTTRRRAGKIGLGLFIVYRMVNELMEGRIEVDSSEKGPGTAFLLELPDLKT